jgi:hypothetical protein
MLSVTRALLLSALLLLISSSIIDIQAELLSTGEMLMRSSKRK